MGPWYAQVDDYHGVRPRPIPPDSAASGPTLSIRHKTGIEAPSPSPAYLAGTNATQFAPHSGLRISARDLAKIMLVLLNQGRDGARQILKPTTVRQMLYEVWRFDPQRWNGDPFYGRYRAWGLGLQHTTGTQDELGGDRLTIDSREQLWGHRGEAYGLLGGMWFDPQRKLGFVYLVGGLGDDPYLHPGNYSSAYRWEELIQTAILDEIDRWETTRSLTR
jgi:CubicO group peptidase (beta-lactamase class C family)